MTNHLKFGVIVNADYSGLWLGQELLHRGVDLFHVQTTSEYPHPKGNPLYDRVFRSAIRCELSRTADIEPFLRLSEFILPGSEAGVLPAHIFNKSLGHKLSAAGDIRKVLDKAHMYSVAKSQNIRVPITYAACNHSQMTAIPEAILRAPTVVKPAMSYNSDNVHFCYSSADVLHAFERIWASKNCHGAVNDCVIVQERINDRQCFINSVSFDERHTITDIWIRDRASDAATRTWTVNLVDPASQVGIDLTSFALLVLNGFGVSFGACHIEAFYSAKGPILLEIAARHAGRTISHQAFKMVLPMTQIELLSKMCFDYSWRSQTTESRADQHKHAAIIPFFADVSGKLKAYFDIGPLQALPTFGSFEKKVRLGDQISADRLIGTCVAFLLLCHEDQELLRVDIDRVEQMRISRLTTVAVSSDNDSD